MEILIPEDMKKQVEQVKQVQDEYIERFRKTLEAVLPIGYTIKVEDGKHLSMCRTPTNKEDLKWSYQRKDLITN